MEKTISTVLHLVSIGLVTSLFFLFGSEIKENKEVIKSNRNIIEKNTPKEEIDVLKENMTGGEIRAAINKLIEEHNRKVK